MDLQSLGLYRCAFYRGNQPCTNLRTVVRFHRSDIQLMVGWAAEPDAVVGHYAGFCQAGACSHQGALFSTGASQADGKRLVDIGRNRQMDALFHIS